MATTVGEAVVKLTFDGKDVTASLNKTSSSIEKSGTNTGKLFGNAWTVAAGQLIAKGISKISSMISSNLGKAISRVDTINNFPKVMSALGYSVEEANTSINQISNALDGLPTALDTTVGDVQKLAATMGNLNTGFVNATSLGISLNNMFLAGGKGTEAASNAMEQYNQMLAAGKADMQSWRSMLDAAPGQLKQLAKTLLGAEASQEDLRQALNNGAVTFDQMNEAIVKLNQEGGDGFASFEEQARSATGGVGTALENVQNRVGKAIGKVIDHIGSEKIAAAIDNISSGFSDIAAVVINIIDFLSQNQWIVEFIGAFAAAVVVLGTAIKIVNLVMYASPITWIIAAIGLVVAGIVLLVTHIQEVGEWFGNVFGAIGEWIGGVANAIGQFVGEVWNNITAFFGTIFKAIGDFFGKVFEVIGSIVGWVWDHTLGPIIDVVKNMLIFIIAILATGAQWVYETIIQPVVDFVSGLVNAVVGFVRGAWQTVTSIIGAVAGWVNDNIIRPVVNFFTGMFNAVVNGVRGFVEGFKNVIGAIAGWINNNVIQPIGRFFSGLWDGVRAGVEAIANVIRNIFGTIVGIIKAPFNGIIGAINGVIDMINSIKVPDWVPVIGGASANLGHIPYLAKGGIVTSPTLAMIGEQGAEAVIPLENNTENWAGELASVLANEEETHGVESQRPIVVNMTNEINNEMDAEDIGRVLMQSIRRAA